MKRVAKCRKCFSVLLIVMIILSSMNSVLQIVHAMGDNDNSSDKSLVHFEDDAPHNLVTETDSKAATTNIRYTTVAWIVRLDTTCTDNDPTNTSPSVQCNPLKDDKYIRLNVGTDFITSRPATSVQCNATETTDCWYMKGTEKRLKNKFVLQSSALAINKFMLDKNFNSVVEGTTLYFSPIFKVTGDPSKANMEFITLQSIRNAEPWARPEDFRQYYDRDAEFKGLRYPLKVESRFEPNNWTLAPQVPDVTADNPDKADKLWSTGPYTKEVVLPNTVTYSGKVLELSCSYQQPMDDTTNVPCNGDAVKADGTVVKKGEGPYFVRDGTGSNFTRKPGMAIGGERVVAKYNTVDCTCSQTVSIPNMSSIGGKVTGSKIAKIVPLQMNMQESALSVQHWDTYLSARSNIQVRVILWRTDTGPNNTGAAPEWSKVAGPDFTVGSGADVVNSYTKEKVLDLLKGNVVPLYNDSLQNYPIPEGGKVSFRYNASLNITSTASDGTVETKSCPMGVSVDAPPFYRPPDLKEYGTYTSEPQYWSEIKQGWPQLAGTGSDETFEAMAGTPTTEQLYFASGGSEFMVDVVVQYMPQTTATRNYTSHFTGVVNGWAMDPIIGGYQHDSAPPAPTARTRTDACGVSKTESVTSKSRSYLKGYTTGEHPTPIYGTEYGWDQSGLDSHIVGDYTDQWSTTVTFDYMRIVKAEIWKLESSKVNGMTSIIGTDEVKAEITQGDPNYFAHIATANTSKGGRLRYSLESAQHDNVIWEEGNSDNCLTNSKDSGPVNEQQKFTERRNLSNQATAVSDVLILQTSTGDQSVMYFEKKSQTAKATENLTVPTTDFDTMWTNNPLSAAKWDVHQIHIGGYNGQYATPTMKYSGGSQGTVATAFDSPSDDAGRPKRPDPFFRLLNIDKLQPLNIVNGEYKTGISSVFYKHLYHYNPNNWPTPYATGIDPLYGAAGQSFISTYSNAHAKVNDIVIHDPVSVEDALVVSLPSSLDQRTPASQSIGGNLQKPDKEYELQLNPDYRQNILTNGDAEAINSDDGTVAGWNTWTATPGSNVSFTNRTGDSWVIAGLHTFEIHTTSNPGGTGANYIGVYYKDVPIKPNTNYTFDGQISCHRCEGYFYLDLYNSDGSVYQSGITNGTVKSTGTPITTTIAFKSGSNVNRVRVHIVKGNGMPDSTAAMPEYVFADNLRLRNMDTQEFIATDPVYMTQQVPNPDYVAPYTAEAVSKTFNYIGAVQEFIAEADGMYTLEVWGAQGGQSSHSSSSANKGGYAKGNIVLKKNQKIWVYVGGAGSSGATGGWNGGGSGYNNGSDSAGGGGATDIRVDGTELKDRVIVAGGGGGNGCTNDVGGVGGGTTGGDGSGSSYLTPGKGGSQIEGGASGGGSANPGTLGNGGNVTGGYGAGGGGGGYFGGGAGGSESGGGNAGGGGSSYTGGVTGGMTTAGANSGNGKVLITAPAHVVPAIGTPTIAVQVVAAGGSAAIPADAYVKKEKEINPNSGAGGYTPGNFILLDYGFQVYFPNLGNFDQGGASGISATTSIRGKGFTDHMDTTKWTKAKYVKFQFDTIYDQHMYKADTWIELPLTTEKGDYKYDFYVPLENKERVSALVQWKSIAINAPYEDNDAPTNRVRYNNLAARHSAFKQFNVDVVGRIGNAAIEDTGDFRFANFFKEDATPKDWLIPQVVRKVDPSRQKNIIGGPVDIYDNAYSSSGSSLDTWGLLPHLRKDPVSWPLSPEKNNIAALQNQPLRIGYNVLTDIQTTGNYYSSMQIIPYYYALNLTDGAIQPVDIYMNVGGVYKPINKFGAAVPGWDPTKVYSNIVSMDWEGEAARRNYSADERINTEAVMNYADGAGANTVDGKAAGPSGSYYAYGTSQIMYLTGKNRTYIGQTSTYGEDKNPGNTIPSLRYAQQAQRWHYHLGLPSSAKALAKDAKPTQENFDALDKSNFVLLMAVDIKAVGDTYVLQYRMPNGHVHIAGTDWSLASVPYPVIAVSSVNRSSADDLSVAGTH